MNRTALSLVTLAVLTSAPAFADRFEHGARAVPRFEGRRGVEAREHGWRRQWTPGPAYRGPISTGHWELRDVQKWVDGQWNQVLVPGRCFMTRWGQRCTPGSYQNVWQEGRYVTVQERVWVPLVYGTSAVGLPPEPCDD